MNHDSWHVNGKLLPQDYAYNGASPSRLSKMANNSPDFRRPVQQGDTAADEIFGSSRRAMGAAGPSYSPAPFVAENNFSPRYRPNLQQLPEQVPHQSGINKKTFFEPFVNAAPPRVTPREVDTSWRAGDLAPLAIDCSPREMRGLPEPRLVRDPELNGGYSDVPLSQMLFGQPPAEKPHPPAPANDLDLQIAKWRMSEGERDPHPFTLGGEVPTHSPRRDPRRQVQPELMMQVPENDHLAAEALRREVGRAQQLSVDGLNVGAFPSPRPGGREVHASQNRSQWRLGEPNGVGFIFGSSASPPLPHASSRVTQYDKSGIGFAFGGYGADGDAASGHNHSPPMQASSPRHKLPVEFQPSPPGPRPPPRVIDRGMKNMSMHDLAASNPSLAQLLPSIAPQQVEEYGLGPAAAPMRNSQRVSRPGLVGDYRHTGHGRPSHELP